MILCEKCGRAIMIENGSGGCAFNCPKCGYVEKVINA